MDSGEGRVFGKRQWYQRNYDHGQVSIWLEFLEYISGRNQELEW